MHNHTISFPENTQIIITWLKYKHMLSIWRVYDILSFQWILHAAVSSI